MGLISRIAAWISRLFNEHMLVRRAMVFWACALITYVVLQVFRDVTLITAAVNGALSIVVGLLTTVIGFYNYQRKLDEEKDDDVDGTSNGD